MTTNSTYVPRVTQLDAVELDSEILKLLKTQIATVAKYANFGLLGKWEPEVDAALRFLLWKHSVWKLHSTFGQQMLGIKYSGLSQNKALMFAVAVIGYKYLKQRSHEIAKLMGGLPLSAQVFQLLDWTDTAIHFAALANLLVFLLEGKYPILVDRLLGLQPISATPHRRVVGYNYLTRELMWHVFFELVAVTAPLIKYHSFKRRIIGFFSSKKKTKTNGNGSFTYKMSTKCAECSKRPVIPHHMGCGHIFCYYCIKANYMADKKYECPLCGYSAESASQIVPVQVVEDED